MTLRLHLPLRLTKSLLIVLAVLAAQSLVVRPLEAQLKKRLLQGVFCAGGGVIGNEIGKRLTSFAVRHADQLKMSPDSIARYEKHLRIGTAAVLCLGGAALAGSTYEKISKRDMAHRRDEILRAVNETDPLSREYVLPESGLKERVTTAATYPDGDRVCRETVVRTAGDANAEPALAVYCRKGNGGWEPEFF